MRNRCGRINDGPLYYGEGNNLKFKRVIFIKTNVCIMQVALEQDSEPYMGSSSPDKSISGHAPNSRPLYAYTHRNLPRIHKAYRRQDKGLHSLWPLPDSTEISSCLFESFTIFPASVASESIVDRLNACIQ